MASRFDFAQPSLVVWRARPSASDSSDLAARTQVRVRTDDRSGTDAGFIQNGAGTDQDTIADFRVLDHAIGANAAVASDPGAAQQLHEGFNDRVGPHLDIRIDDAT